MDDASQQTQRAHFRAVVRAYEAYEAQALEQVNRRRCAFAAMPLRHRQLLPDQVRTDSVDVKLSWQLHLFMKMEDAIMDNAEVLRALVAAADGFLGDDVSGPETAPTHSHGHAHGPSHDHGGHSHDRPPDALTDDEHGRVHSVLRQIVREWSADGKTERDAVHGPLIATLIEWSDGQRRDRSRTRVLMPGTGLGRLPFDVAAQGFLATGNESSLPMLLASNFILNACERAEQYRIQPRVHSLSNHERRAEILHSVPFPDVSPLSLTTGELAQAAGDFVEIYGREDERGQWDAVLTSFFIDTARNVITYLETIFNGLADDGIWINCGPLLWHFEDDRTGRPGGAVELALDDLVALAERMGFVVSTPQLIEVGYTSSSTMLRTEYRAAFFTATKSKPQ